MSDFQLKRKKLISQLSSIDVEFQSHTFETTILIALYDILFPLSNVEIYWDYDKLHDGVEFAKKKIFF